MSKPSTPMRRCSKRWSPLPGSRRVSVRVWTTTDKDAYNAGHELVIPGGGRATESDRETAAEFFGCERDRVASIRRTMTEQEYGKMPDAADYA